MKKDLKQGNERFGNRVNPPYVASQAQRGHNERAVSKPLSRKISAKKIRLGKKRLKDYGKVLLAKQLLRALYNNPSEKVFKKYFGRDKSMNDAIGKLSSRLEIVLTAMGGALSNGHARQLINHGKISVNGHIVRERGYLLKDGDIVASSVDFVTEAQKIGGFGLQTKSYQKSRADATIVASIKPSKIPKYLKLQTPVAGNMLVNADLKYGIYYSKEINSEFLLPKEKAQRKGVSEVGLGWKNTNVKAVKNLLLEMKTANYAPKGEAEKMKLCAVLYNLVQSYYSRVC